jgi:hypothetical protein
MLYKKRTCLLSVKMGTVLSRYGRMDIFDSIYQCLYLLLFLLSIVNHHSSWSSSFICDNNENVFMNGKQLGSLYWNSCRFGEGRNRKFYNFARIVTEMLSTCPLFIKR